MTKNHISLRINTVKRIVAVMLLTAAALSLAACSDTDSGTSSQVSSSAVSASESSCDVALVTLSNGTADEYAKNAWSGIVSYGDSAVSTYQYFTAESDDLSGKMAAVASAVESGAQIIVFPSEEFADAAYQAQYDYPDTGFILNNALPATENADGETTSEISENVHCVYYKEEQAGYLAGYSTIMEGLKTLVFIGDAENAENLRYFYGFIQGIDDGMQILRVHDIEVYYTFINPTEEKAKSTAESFYSDGTDVIFAYNETIVKAVGEAAVESGKRFITLKSSIDDDTDYGDSLLTTVNYVSSKAVEMSLSSYFQNGGTWIEAAAGKAIKFGIENGCITLDTSEDAWNFTTFTESQYDEKCDEFVADSVVLTDETDEPPLTAKVSYSYVDMG